MRKKNKIKKEKRADKPKRAKKEKKPKKQKRFSKKKIEKKLLKKIYIPDDRAFVQSLFVAKKQTVESEDGLSKKALKAAKKEKKFIYFKKDISPAELKRFKKIKKEVKKGKGKVKKVPLTILAVIIILIAVFVIFIKNPLFERYCERGLEKLFEATVEIDHMRVSFLKGGFRFSRIQVTDKDNLEYNLFELGRTDAGFNRRALLVKKFVLESFVSKDMRWNTKREKPGRYLGKGNLQEGSAIGMTKRQEPTQPTSLRILAGPSHSDRFPRGGHFQLQHGLPSTRRPFAAGRVFKSSSSSTLTTKQLWVDTVSRFFQRFVIVAWSVSHRGRGGAGCQRAKKGCQRTRTQCSTTLEEEIRRLIEEFRQLRQQRD